MEEEEEDSHMCLRCKTIVVGLDQYVEHRKQGCQVTWPWLHSDEISKLFSWDFLCNMKSICFWLTYLSTCFRIIIVSKLQENLFSFCHKISWVRWHFCHLERSSIHCFLNIWALTWDSASLKRFRAKRSRINRSWWSNSWLFSALFEWEKNR